MRKEQFTRGTITAAVLLGVGVTGTILDPNGPAGVVLFGIAALAALDLVRRAVRSLPGEAAVARRRRFDRRRFVGAVRGRTVAAVVASMGVLFALWLTAELSRPLVYACWWSFCGLGAWLIAVTVLAAHRSLRPSN